MCTKAVSSALLAARCSLLHRTFVLVSFVSLPSNEDRLDETNAVCCGDDPNAACARGSPPTACSPLCAVTFHALITGLDTLLSLCLATNRLLLFFDMACALVYADCGDTLLNLAGAANADRFATFDQMVRASTHAHAPARTDTPLTHTPPPALHCTLFTCL